MMKEFNARKERLKTVSVGSCDQDRQPNCAPKMLVDVVLPNQVFILDYRFTRTYANITQNPQLSMSFMDDGAFTGYRFNGTCRLIESGDEYERVKEMWRKRLTSYQATRIVERIKGYYSARDAENILPDDFVIIKFEAVQGSVVKPDRILRACREDEHAPVRKKKTNEGR